MNTRAERVAPLRLPSNRLSPSDGPVSRSVSYESLAERPKAGTGVSSRSAPLVPPSMPGSGPVSAVTEPSMFVAGPRRGRRLPGVTLMPLM